MGRIIILFALLVGTYGRPKYGHIIIQYDDKTVKIPLGASSTNPFLLLSNVLKHSNSSLPSTGVSPEKPDSKLSGLESVLQAGLNDPALAALAHLGFPLPSNFPKSPAKDTPNVTPKSITNANLSGITPCESELSTLPGLNSTSLPGNLLTPSVGGISTPSLPGLPGLGNPVTTNPLSILTPKDGLAIPTSNPDSSVTPDISSISGSTPDLLAVTPKDGLTSPSPPDVSSPSVPSLPVTPPGLDGSSLSTPTGLSTPDLHGSTPEVPPVDGLLPKPSDLKPPGLSDSTTPKLPGSGDSTIKPPGLSDSSTLKPPGLDNTTSEPVSLDNSTTPTLPGLGNSPTATSPSLGDLSTLTTGLVDSSTSKQGLGDLPSKLPGSGDLSNLKLPGLGELPALKPPGDLPDPVKDITSGLSKIVPHGSENSTNPLSGLKLDDVIHHEQSSLEDLHKKLTGELEHTDESTHHSSSDDQHKSSSEESHHSDFEEEIGEGVKKSQSFW